MDEDIICNITKEIWNKSVENIYGKSKNKVNFNILKWLSEYSFKNIDNRTKKFINTKLNIAPILEKLNYNSAPINLKFLIKTLNLSDENKIIEISKKNSLLFPIRKLLIVEGITEEILLPVFASKLKTDFNKEGIYILGAGGKSKSPNLYLKLKDKLKIPVILLFDSDAMEICSVLKKNISSKDKILIIQNGEFEDILSLNLIKRSLNKEYETALPVIKDDLCLYPKMCDNLEHFYRTRQLGEFKKAKLSKIIANNVKYKTDISDEIKSLILQI